MELPRLFLDEISGYGDPALSGIAAALSDAPSVSVRFNRGKRLGPAPGADIVPWCRAGCYLPGRPAFTFDPAMHQGLYYVQDASSMFISRILSCLTSHGRPVRYLDACAAPGGKTTAAIDALPSGSVVVANEYVPARAAVLRENLAKWGYPLCVVTQGDTSRFTPCAGIFDIIAADVPCSGEGMMRKDPEAVAQWSPELVRQCAVRQMAIVDNLWPALAPGGYFIYSTCTFNRHENEEIVRYIMERYGAESVEIDTDPSWAIGGAIATDAFCYRFTPGAVRGEGQFMAVLRKPGHVADSTREPVDRSGRKKAAQKSKPAVVPEAVKRWLTSGSADFTVSGDSIVALPHIPWPAFPFVPQIPVATIRGRDIIPTQHLAMSMLLDREAFPEAEVEAPVAIDYLRCESVVLDPSAPRGVVLLNHGGRPLGFAKNLGTRANNLYPKPWRILSPRPPHLPSLLSLSSPLDWE